MPDEESRRERAKQRELLHQAHQGDRKAFIELTAPHFTALRDGARKAVRGIPCTEADDLIQDVLICGWEITQKTDLALKIDPRTDGTGPNDWTVLKWLRRIMRFRCLAYLKTIRHDLQLEILSDAALAAHGAIDRSKTVSDDACLRAWADEMIRALKPHHRDAVILVDRNGCDYVEAAARLKIPVNTLKSRLNRARTLLRVMANNGGTK